MTPFSRFRSQPSGNTAVSTIHSDCHVTMRTGESMQRVKPGAWIPCWHTLWFSRCGGVVHTWIRHISLNFLPCWFLACGEPHHLDPIVYSF